MASACRDSADLASVPPRGGSGDADQVQDDGLEKEGQRRSAAHQVGPRARNDFRSRGVRCGETPPAHGVVRRQLDTASSLDEIRSQYAPCGDARQARLPTVSTRNRNVPWFWPVDAVRNASPRFARRDGRVRASTGPAASTANTRLSGRSTYSANHAVRTLGPDRVPHIASVLAAHVLVQTSSRLQVHTGHVSTNRHASCISSRFCGLENVAWRARRRRSSVRPSAIEIDGHRGR